MRFKTLSFIMLALAVLWLIRVGLTRNLHMDFILGNVLLAAVPLLLEPLFSRAHAVRPVLAAVWLLFLPNAFYLLTDFMHLNPGVLVNARNDQATYITHYVRGDSLFMLDSLLIFAATAFGAYAGGMALLHAYQYLRRHFSRNLAQAAISVIVLLVAVGVYIGRYGRWNSWQGLIQPHQIVADLVQTIMDQTTRGRFVEVVLVVIAFEAACLWFAWIYQRNRSKPSPASGATSG